MEQGPREQLPAERATGLGYPGMQLARALARAEQCQDPQEQARAQERAEQWSAALFGILSGGIRPGSRTPVSGLPAWATLQVVTGGFATGDVLSGGPLQPHELALLEALGLQRLRGEAARQALNTWFLTEEGQQQLGQWLQSGCYEVRVPEEGALLAIHGLARCGQSEAARAVLDELAPYFGRMRFFPKPAEVPVDLGSRVCLEPAGQTAERLATKRANRQVQAQQESVTVWTPFYDELVALFLETVDGPPPLALRTEAGVWRRNERGTIELTGGCEFSPKFAAAAHMAWQLIGGTLYARYYGIAEDPSQHAAGFAALCAARAGPRPAGRSVACNGCVIEQQQILTTHNLAVLIHGLELRDRLAEDFEPLAKRCFDWVCRRLRMPAPDWHSRLIHIKHAAYAWRQMVLFLAMCSEEQAVAFDQWARQRLLKVPGGLREKLNEALGGLGLHVAREPGRKAEEGGVFFGWTIGRHWMT